MDLLHGSRSVCCFVGALQSGTLVIALVITTGELGRNAFLWLLSWALVALGLGSGNHGFRYSSRASAVPTLWKRWTFGTLVCLQRLRPHRIKHKELRITDAVTIYI